MSNQEVRDKIEVLKNEVYEKLREIRTLAVEAGISVSLGGNDVIYSDLSMDPPEYVQREDGTWIDPSTGEEVDEDDVWTSSTEGMWASSSDRC